MAFIAGSRRHSSGPWHRARVTPLITAVQNSRMMRKIASGTHTHTSTGQKSSRSSGLSFLSSRDHGCGGGTPPTVGRVGGDGAIRSPPISSRSFSRPLLVGESEGDVGGFTAAAERMHRGKKADRLSMASAGCNPKRWNERGRLPPRLSNPPLPLFKLFLQQSQVGLLTQPFHALVYLRLRCRSSRPISESPAR